MPAELRVYSIGYEKRSLEEFIGLLKASGITLLIDVRDVPWSHKPGFSKAPLLKALAAAGIRYHHAKFAGNPKALRRGAGGTAELLKRYQRHLDGNPQIVHDFRRLLDAAFAEGLIPVVMCFERKPEECHRSLLLGRTVSESGLGTADIAWG